ncbi:hypothetical protein [Isoptericola sp. BMS4]|uniref:hypothetical protein n=1 Tax=Isoptericola sp. BMS4 TaxID=2527875 RepID=UPI0014227BF8|nr:hypothetical protein [Isoptericola sp. BMS4]
MAPPIRDKSPDHPLRLGRQQRDLDSGTVAAGRQVEVSLRLESEEPWRVLARLTLIEYEAIITTQVALAA